MSTGIAAYSYDSLGRLVQVTFPNGAQAIYSYDSMGNRTTVLEVPATITPDCCPPTVSALPKSLHGDLLNSAMMVKLSTGELIGWGDNTTGALANGVAAATNAPAQRLLFDPNTTLPPFDATIVDWSFTNANLYVVFSNGWVYSAGKNDYGQLGHGDTVARPQLKRIEYFVTQGKSITKVWALGGFYSTNGGGCVYFQASDFNMYGCGANTSGNLGNAATPTSNVSTPAPCAGIPITPNHVVDVAIGVVNNLEFSAFMLFDNGALKVAGDNGTGQLGIGSTTNQTGSFVDAKKTGSVPITNVASVSANGGRSSTTNGGNALVVDTSGNVWTTGYNAQGQLGLSDTTQRTLFTQVTALSNITKAEIGGGRTSYAYALNAAGQLYTWGYNGQNNLFRNNTTTPVSTPSLAPFVPGVISKVFFPNGDGLSSSGAQLIVLTTSGQLTYAGADNGQIGIDSAVNPGAYKYIPTPRQFLDGTETIADIFVHGSQGTQRLFILSNTGNLYACGSNLDSICTGGVASDVMAANVLWFKINFSR